MEITFRKLVQDCAMDQAMLDAFHKVHPEHSNTPIYAVLCDKPPPNITEAEQLRVGCFVLWVYDKLWTRLQLALAKQLNVGASVQLSASEVWLVAVGESTTTPARRLS